MYATSRGIRFNGNKKITHLFEIWDTFSSKKSSKLVRISEDGLTYSQVDDNGDDGDQQCVFGQELIESMDNNFVYSWTLKITNRDPIYYCPIGITPDYEYDRNGNGETFDCINTSYSYNAYNGFISTSHGGPTYVTEQQEGYRKLAKNDTLTITLDMNKGHLTFKAIKDNKNPKSVTIGNFVKMKDLKYRLAIMSAIAGDSMQIVSFSKVYSE